MLRFVLLTTLLLLALTTTTALTLSPRPRVQKPTAQQLSALPPSSLPPSSCESSVLIRGGAPSPPSPPSASALVHAFIPCAFLTHTLTKSIRRLIPYTTAPLSTTSMTTIVPMYLAAASFFAYYEAYKGFHLKFTPMFVARSFNLHSQNVLYRYPLAVIYSTGLIESSRKRKITSVCVTAAVAVLVLISKRLAPLNRGILDVGVCVGLGGGVLSLWGHFITFARTGQIQLEGWSESMEGYPAKK